MEKASARPALIRAYLQFRCGERRGIADEKQLALVAGNVVHLFELPSLRVILPLTNSEPVRAAAFSPDANWLAIAAGKYAAVWNARTGQRFAAV